MRRSMAALLQPSVTSAARSTTPRCSAACAAARAPIDRAVVAAEGRSGGMGATVARRVAVDKGPRSWCAASRVTADVPRAFVRISHARSPERPLTFVSRGLTGIRPQAELEGPWTLADRGSTGARGASAAAASAVAAASATTVASAAASVAAASSITSVAAWLAVAVTVIVISVRRPCHPGEGGGRRAFGRLAATQPIKESHGV